MRLQLVAFLAFAPHIAWAQSPPAPPAPTVTRLGSRNVYGPGIVAATSRQVAFELTRPAHVIVLLVDPDGSILPVFPTPDVTITERAPGYQVIALNTPVAAEEPGAGPRAPPVVISSSQQLAREGRPWHPSAAGDDPPPKVPVLPYWLVILSDVPTSAAEVQDRLASMRMEFSSLQAELEAVARALVARRSKVWSALYTPAGS